MSVDIQNAPAMSADVRDTVGELSTPFIHLRAGGVSVLMSVQDRQLPSMIHWGPALSNVSDADAHALWIANREPVVPNASDEPITVSLLPEPHTAWTGVPGLSGHRGGADWSPRFQVTNSRLDAAEHESAGDLTTAGAGTLTVLAEDVIAQLQLSVVVELTDSGLVRAQASVRNTGADVYDLEAVNIVFPIPQEAREILDFAGRWGLERVPQRAPLNVGIHEREGRRGRTGADAATILSVGAPGFGFRSGDIWGIHVGWSGNHRHYAERLFNGKQVIGAGELLLPGEVRLEAGQSYQTPWVYAAYGRGLDDQAQRFHRYLRGRSSHPSTPRPVTLNVWEAVYFDHDFDRLKALATKAAELGVERFVLDDGWFRGRRDDTAGLGDWYIDDSVWPQGLTPLIDHVRALGMEFGLWFEPEMINLDSDLARRHPEWVMSTGERVGVSARNQHVLNLGIPEAYDYIFERITAILRENAIGYIKWDHNRDLIDAGTWPTGRAGVHDQTLATYRLMDEIKALFPALEIESCSSGGGRVDLGILERTDRVWVSDCIDPHDRQQMNRWTMQLLPPELLGSHVASGASHTTGRQHRLSFRAGTALLGHFGIEWDLGAATDTELRELAAWIALYKAQRPLLHTGELIRADTSDPSVLLYGVADAARDRAVFFLAYVDRSEVSPRGRFTIPGLDGERRYRVSPVFVGSPGRGFVPPPWFGPATNDGELVRFEGIECRGDALRTVGVQMPAAFPDTVQLLEIVAVDTTVHGR